MNAVSLPFASSLSINSNLANLNYWFLYLSAENKIIQRLLFSVELVDAAAAASSTILSHASDMHAHSNEELSVLNSSMRRLSLTIDTVRTSHTLYAHIVHDPLEYFGSVQYITKKKWSL